MRLKLFIKFGILSLFIIISANANIKQGTDMKQDSTTIISKYFSLNELSKERTEAGEPFIKFLNVPTMEMFIYSLPAGGVDKQNPHKLDEVYYVTEGIAELSVEDKNYTVKQGSIIFVKAGAKHKFHSIKKDLTVIVFFSTADPAK